MRHPNLPSPQGTKPKAPRTDINVTQVNTMNYHNPIIQTMKIDYVAIRTIAIQCEEMDMGIYDHVINSNYEPDQYVHRSVAALTSVIISSSTSYITTEIITHRLQINTAQLVQPVQRHVSRNSEPEKFTLTGGKNTLHTHFDNIEKLFEAHDKIRTSMINDRCQGIFNECTTLKCILKIFRDHPTFKPKVLQCIRHQPT